jgi:hypothetical protein
MRLNWVSAKFLVVLSIALFPISVLRSMRKFKIAAWLRALSALSSKFIFAPLLSTYIAFLPFVLGQQVPESSELNPVCLVMSFDIDINWNVKI